MAKPKILSKEEILKLNKEGHHLSDSSNKLYISSFLINDKQNQAGDPDPFKIKSEALLDLAETAVGRPWILPPDGNDLHITGPEREFNSIIEYQKSYAGGEMVDWWVNQETHNVNVIIEVLPEYQDRVRAGDYPAEVSPLVEFQETDPKTGELTKGRIIHLQSVNHGGYGKVAKINGLCEGMLGQCMSELKIKGATSSLTSYQKQHSAIFKKMYSKTKQMSENLTVEKLAEQVNAMPKLIDDKFAALKTEIASLVKGASAVVQEGSPDATDIKSVSQKNPPKNPPTNLSEADRIKTLEDQLAIETKKREDTEKLMAEEKEKITKEKRLKLATDIVNYEMQLKQINPKQQKEQVKYYFELKLEDDETPADLTLLHKKLSEQVNKIKGAWGDDLIIASLDTTPSDTPINYMELHDRFSGVHRN